MLKLTPKGRKSKWHSMLHVPSVISGQSRGPGDTLADASGTGIPAAIRLAGRRFSGTTGKPGLGDALAPVLYRSAMKWFRSRR